MFRLSSRFGLALTIGATIATRAHATWSILLVDVRTGEIAVGSATCLTNFDLRAGTPVLIPGVGAATAQSAVDSTGSNRTLIRDLLASGARTQDILSALSMFDPSHQARQYGIVTALGDPTTFTGIGAGAWAGGNTGVITGAGVGGGDLYYAIQGNVLSGPSVVAAAVAAVESTPGDLAEKLMASMEAARMQGGDGRCSCASGNPTGCGDPPDEFTKSAHIAYMLVARAGDQESCAPTYRLQSRNSRIFTGPLEESRSLAMFVPENADDIEAREILGDVAPGRLAASFQIPSFLSPREAVIQDVTGDGLSDILLAVSGGEGLVLLEALDDQLNFAAPTLLFGGSLVSDVAVADIDGDTKLDIATVDLFNSTLAVLWGNNDNVFTERTELTLSNNPLELEIEQLNGTGSLEIALLGTDASVYGFDAQRQFVLQETHAVPVLGSRLKLIDSAQDGRPDLLISGNTTTVTQIVRKPGLPASIQNYSTNFPPTSMDVGDVTGDGLDDAVLVTGVNTTVLEGFSFIPDLLLPTTILLPNSPRDAELCDFDNDGDLDLVYSASSIQSARLVNNTGSGFAQANGCASGTYFLNLNVPFASVTDPDPVFTLRDRFDAWRASRVGVTDAVESGASLDRDVLNPDPACQRTLTVELRDYLGVPVAGLSPANLTIEHAVESAGASAIGPVKSLGEGRFSVTIAGQNQAGEDVLRVTVTEPASGEPVVLMPSVRLLVRDLADLDEDGDYDANDFNLWISFYQAQDPRADQNRDGLITPADFSAWLGNVSSPC